ncbi:MAG: LytTR family transcriptional regulator [Bacteroidales bacterium]|nr:LytTR family transcriptional regulator [Bacteroidales bacterium]
MTSTIVHQPENLPATIRFLGHRDSVFLFLALTSAFTILLLVFGNPTALFNYIDQRNSMSPLGVAAICFAIGFILLTFSRFLLLLFHRRRMLQHATYYIWLIIELLFCTSIITLTLWAISGGGTLRLTPLVTMVAIGYLVLQIIPYIISFLIFQLGEAKTELLHTQQLLEKQSAIATPAADRVFNFFNKAGHLALSTKSSNVLYLEAADNYVNIHYINDDTEATLLLFNSMKSLETHFADTPLVRCHRGFMVNVDNVHLIRKESQGLVLELNHTSRTIPVSKNYADLITDHFASLTHPDPISD